MNRSDLDFLRDVRSFAQYARDNAGGLSADTLADAKQPQHAALYDLVVIGEALSKVSSAVKSAAPEIPWRAIINLRNIIVHSYWQVDLVIIADVIANHIDPLVVDLDGLIAFVERMDK
jgi:uncharacterized protein with HEPN domain